MAHLNPGQNYDHLLDPISGYDGMHDLQFQGATSETFIWHRGSLMGVHDADGLIRPFGNLTADNAKHAMGLWAINASYDFDVAGGGSWGAGADPLYRLDAGNIAGQTLASNNVDAATRRIGTFVATGGFELVTTEFVAGTYAPNDPLVPAVAGGDVTADYANGEITKGTLTAGVVAPAENVVGVVSSGTRTETYGQSVLQFWPVYHPATA